jgi:hypothetical protein
MEKLETEPRFRWMGVLVGALALALVTLLGAGGGAVLAANPSTTTVTSSVNPSAFGQPILFSASVMGTGPTATGTVTFVADGFITLGTGTLSGGVASITSAALGPGSHSVVASYSGDANFLSSNGNTVQTVLSSGAGFCGVGVVCPGASCTSGFFFGACPFTNCTTTGGSAVTFIPGVGFVPVAAPGLGSVPGTCGSNCVLTASGIVACTPTSSTTSTSTSAPPAGVVVQVLSGGGTAFLDTGCNQVTVSTVAGTQISAIAFRVSPSGNVVAIWRFNNSIKIYQAGYFSVGAPLDITTTLGGPESYYVCVSQPASITSG